MKETEANLEDLLPFYILGTLTADEIARVEAYLRTNSEARMWVDEMRPVAEALALSVEPMEPVPATKRNLLKRIRAEQASQELPARRFGFLERLRQLAASPSRMRLETLVVSISLFIALLSLGWALSISREITRLRHEVGDLQASVANQEQIILYLSNPNSRSVVIAGTEHRPEARGNVIFAPEESVGGLLIKGLVPLESGLVYQLWLIEGETPQSAGTFNVDASGQAVVPLAAAKAIAEFDALGVSIEPTGGSLQPTGDIVLLGSLTEDT